ncbi:hypothetical protein A7U60_g3496 [Sanghuangporus baumii]|uniref:Cytochrome P450 n=1 Tax=Sanghuangporus baumii TaxID=108892 RepID=A0A9Q5N6R2_SANBA|nr:hypothetical protein A7U60_g3496 [Sanghuangporus baumii]
MPTTDGYNLSSMQNDLVPLMYAMHYIGLCLGIGLLGGVLRFILSHSSKTRQQTNLPPIIPIPDDQIYSNPREAYENAFKVSGSHVVGVKKKGRNFYFELEFIVDDTLLHDVLTNNQAFNFQDGVMTLLNMKFLNDSFTDYFARHDDLVRNAIVNRMPFVINQVFPVFMKNAEKLMREVNSNQRKHVDALEFFHYSLCEAMTKVILGGGLYEGFLEQKEVIGPAIWRKLTSGHRSQAAEEESFADSEGSVLDYLTCKYASGTENVGLQTFLKISGLISGNFFAAIHITSTVSVWVLFELSRRPELVSVLREELTTLVDIPASGKELPVLSYEVVQNAKILDSFIREVLRTKGDILSVCRMIRNDVRLDGYDLPKDHLIFGLTTLLHLSPKYQGSDASEIKYDRWVLTNKSAATIGKSYLSFGLGRWACPGRALAIAEIKMLIWSIICRATPVLEGGSYDIVDRLEITARAPRGKLVLVPYST